MFFSRLFSRGRILMASVEQLKSSGIIPQVIPSCGASSNVNFEVSYESSSGAKVTGGNVLTPTRVSQPPKVSWTAEPGSFYALVLTDPDAPSRKDPKWAEWRHWTVVNVPGSDVAKGEHVVQYVGSGPPQGSGLHRYVFLLFKQSGKLEDLGEKHIHNDTATGRSNWSVAKWAQERKFGEPVAVTWYEAEWDDYVPKLYAQLKH
ncbi:mitochondrial ribosomal protein L38 (mL38) [Andalucia godoyi]|uniref:Mitochondrial ribosomal protein L38 (ML38) n=1 Tax=Andalucia godoyi TaxID=505711 RepID=A0A8K0AIC0_ANDGO|nr:mitochondrial ribosomal protein L38 (mL38) [Andalucia godoyi]|eukprot:ANDGO_00545.mRNA.1 mitochondrial ribosomal protein L38 (mL38)